MSDKSFDIDIKLSDPAPQWPAPLIQGPYFGREEVPSSGTGGAPPYDEFDIDIRFSEIIVGDPPTKGPFLGLSGPFGWTCSNTCGVGSGCANSGCGGITCTCTVGCTNGCTGTCVSCEPCGGGVDGGWGDDDDDDG